MCKKICKSHGCTIAVYLLPVVTVVTLQQSPHTPYFDSLATICFSPLRCTHLHQSFPVQLHHSRMISFFQLSHEEQAQALQPAHVFPVTATGRTLDT